MIHRNIKLAYGTKECLNQNKFVSLLDEMIQEDSEQAVFGLKRITLASLLKAHKVDFFDDFGAYSHKEWKLNGQLLMLL